MRSSQLGWLLALSFVACSSTGSGESPPGDAGDDTATTNETGADSTALDAPELDSTATDSSGPDVGGPDTSPPDAPVDLGGTIVTPGDPGATDVKLTVRADTAVRAISPLIYGLNGTTDAKNRPSIVRSGGNRLTAYNWENNGSNAGNDYCFQNDRTFVPPSGPNTPGYAVKPMLDDAKAKGHTTLVTVPIVDYVAADTNDNGDGGAGPPSCVGDVRKSGAGYLATRFKQNKPTKGSAFTLTPDPADAFVYQDEFVNWVKAGWGAQTVLFSLDNEPDLWSDTHAEIHPAKVGYDELIKRNVDYAKAIKASWPAAQTLGFVSYGYAGYTTLQDAPDRAGKGDFTDYYLKKLKEAETAAGKRLVDYLDLHWYPEARGGGVRVSGVGDATAAAARVQAPRSLWDATYKEDSWIANDVVGGPIRLLPRYLAKIDTNYPGTRLAISEWSYGGGNHISGAVATADVLGVFGRTGVGLATLWFLHGAEPFTLAGLRAFTNFDGAGAKFGDTSISGTASDDAVASVYASIDAGSPSRVVLVVVTKATTTKTAGITVAHATTFTKAKVWQLAGTTPNPVASADVAAVATNAFKYTMPAMSVSVLLLQP